MISIDPATLRAIAWWAALLISYAAAAYALVACTLMFVRDRKKPSERP